MHLYLFHTNVIVLLLRRCLEQLRNLYMCPQSMPVTYRKQVYISLVLTDSFHQTAIWAHSTQRIKSFEKCFLQSPQLCSSAFRRFLWYHLSAVFPRYFLKPLTFSSLPFILYLLHSSSCSDILWLFEFLQIVLY